MRKTLFLLSTMLFVAPMAIAAQAGFGIDAFNRTVSAATHGNVVFSPISFEIDCVIFSEACDALSRAKIAETMGVLNGLSNSFQPIYKELTQDNGEFSFLTARAFCLPDERRTKSTYRHWMQQTFAAEAFGFNFKKGAECWFRARMDGFAEDFEIPVNAGSEQHYSYFDLVDFHCPWRNPSASNVVEEIEFKSTDGSIERISAIKGVRSADEWQRRTHSIVRMPLADHSWLFTFMPNEGHSVRDIRGDISSKTFIDIITGINSIGESGISHGNALVVIPKMDILTELEMKRTFDYFHFPTSGMERMEKGIRPRYLRQRVHFRLDESGIEDTPQAIASENSEDIEVTAKEKDNRKIILNRPFLFFVYHEPTASLPVIGQFSGK